MDVWQQPVRGVVGDLGMLALPGIDRFSVRNDLAPPPIHHLTGMRPTEATKGRCVFAMPATGWLRNSVGTVPLGVLAFLADAPLGGVLIAGLGAGQLVSTSQLTLNAVRPVDVSADRLLAQAELVHLGRLLALSQGRVLDGQGRMVATMSTRCVVASLPLPADIPPPARAEHYPTPSPWETPPAGALLTAEQLESSSGAEVMRAAVEHDPAVPPPPLHHLFGLRPTALADRTMTWTMPATAWLSSGAPTMYGGAIALLADVAMSGTAWTVVPLGSLPFTLDLNVRFLRPVPLEGDLTAEADVVHVGRTLVVVQSRVSGADGKTVALADGSCAVVPLDVRHLPLEDALADRLAATP